MATVPTKSLNRAELSISESASPGCAVLVFVQGGFLAGPLSCWTDNQGHPQDKTGCLSLKIPSEDWENNLPQGGPIAASDPGGRIAQIAPQSWDVTDLFNAPIPTGFRPPAAPDLGFGYLLIGAISDVDKLDATDNSRCTSMISNIRIDVAYTVPPIQPKYESDVR